MSKISFLAKKIIMSIALSATVLGHAEDIDRNELPKTSTASTTPITTQEKKARLTCYTMGMLAYNIMGDKYQKIPLEKSRYYNTNNSPRLAELFGKSLPNLQILTKTIYDLPYMEDLREQKNQLDMVENLVTTSCAISLSS